MENEKEIEFTIVPLFPGENENSNLTRISEEDKRYTCVFCRSSTIDEVSLGPLYYAEGVVTHYFCMLFAAALDQTGTDKEGILGFLPELIMAEVRRATRLRCIYCHVIGAPVGCCEKKCKATFHFTCGLANGANYQFFGNFESYCVNHSRQRRLETLPPDLECPICRNLHESTDNIIVGSCCRPAVFHRVCIQQHAYSAGYFFKCPCCNSKKSFCQDMKFQGIFVPEQDAAWEREPNAFEDLLFEYSQCDAPDCQCPKGREHGSAKGQWLLARCRICGAAGIHRECGKLQTIAKWACDPCLEVETRTESEKEKKTAKKGKKLNTVPETTSIASAQQAGPSSSAISASIPTAIPIVKTPNRKAKRTGTKTFPGDLKDEESLSSVTIVPACYDYFPHKKEDIQKFAKNKVTVLPDWRKFVLNVEIVDMFAGINQEATNSTNTNNPVVVTAKKPLVASNKKRKAAPKSDTSEQVNQVKQQRKTSTEKRNATRKRSSWQKGVVKSRSKKPSLKSKNLSSAEQTVSETASHNSDQDGPPPSCSKAVLEGIRRSQHSLLGWLSSTSSEPGLNGIKTEKSIVKIEPGITDDEQNSQTQPKTDGRSKRVNSNNLNGNSLNKPRRQNSSANAHSMANGQPEVYARIGSRGNLKSSSQTSTRPKPNGTFL